MLVIPKYRTLRRIRVLILSLLGLVISPSMWESIGLWGESGSNWLTMFWFLVTLLMESIGLWGRIWTRIVLLWFLYSVLHRLKYRTLRENLSLNKIFTILSVWLSDYTEYRTLRKNLTSKCSLFCSVYLVYIITSIGLWGRIWGMVVVRIVICIVTDNRKYRTLRENLD
jgi:hypothetical protein